MSETRFYPVVTNNTDNIEKLDGQIIFDIDNKSISIDIDNSRFAVQSVDSELSEISKNPVQNKVIAEKLYDIEEKISNIEAPEIPELPTDLVRGTGKLFTLTSEAAIQEHLVSDDLGALISYIGEDVYDEVVHQPIKVGDTVDTLYFNTSVEPDLNAIKASSTIIKGADIHQDFASSYFALALETVGGGAYLGFTDMSEMQEGLWAIMLFGGEGIIYLSQDIPAEITGGDSFAAGWQMDSIDIQNTFGGEVSVTQIGGQEVWGAYISKEPFVSRSLYKKNTLYMVVEEESESLTDSSIIAKPVVDPSLEKAELPEVSAADAGKVLSVNTTGTWTASAPETAFQQINISLSDTSFVTKDIDPNVFYVFDQPLQVSLTINLNEGKPGVMHEYMFQFSVGHNLTLHLPGNVQWINQELPTFTTGHTYQVSILNNLAVCGEF